MTRMAVAGVQGFVPSGDGGMLCHCEELAVAGRVGRTSVFGRQERATYMVILGEHIEAGALPSCGKCWGPTPARSVSRSCSRVGARSNNYSVVGRGGSSGPSAYPASRPRHLSLNRQQQRHSWALGLKGTGPASPTENTRLLPSVYNRV